jgi:hypothetical protein
MSDLLNSASLVMIPSGYKEDVVYSAVPTDGSGDLSFTRASNGTRVNSAGLVEVTPWNLLEQSETFDNAYWQKANVTVSANATTAPNGTATADKIISSAVNDEHLIYYFESTYFNQVVTLSAYVKKADYRYAIIRSYTNGNYQISVFDLNNGVVEGQVLGASTIESVGNGWYRISTTFTTPAGTFGVQYGFSATPTYSYLGDGTSGNFLWGAQLNIGSTAKPYFPTTDRLNVPRLTYQNGGGGCPSLLLEKQSTNLLLQSEDFTFTSGIWLSANGGGTASVSVTANYGVSPDGTQNADRIQLNKGNTGYAEIYQLFSTTISSTYTQTLWLKSLSGTPKINFGYTGTTRGTITLTTEWQRYEFTYNSGGNPNGLALTLFDGFDPSTAQSIDVLAWGAQAEQSSYPTTYIPTTSASATRVADECKKSGIGALIGGTSGTVFFDIKTNPTLSSANYKQFCYYINSGASQSYMFLDGVNKIQTNVNWGNLLYNTAFQPNTRYKVALVFAPNDFALYINGVSVATASSGTPNNNVDIQIGQFNGTEMCEFVFNQYTHFPSRLTNAELASLTTI